MEELLNGASIPAIAAIVYWVVNLIKSVTQNNEKVKRLIPLISTGLGIICGVVAFFAVPQIMPTDNIIVALIFGGASGLTATGYHQIFKQQSKDVEGA